MHGLIATYSSGWKKSLSNLFVYYVWILYTHNLLNNDLHTLKLVFLNSTHIHVTHINYYIL